MTRSTLFVVVSGFPPVYEFGGPAVSVSNMMSILGDSVDKSALTMIRSEGERRVELDSWECRSDHRVFFASSLFSYIREVRNELEQGFAEVVYINSLFSPIFAWVPIAIAAYAHRKYRRPWVLIAPRGELDPGALRVGRIKKRLALTMLKIILRLIGPTVVFHASSATEKERIEVALGQDFEVRVALNPPRLDFLELDYAPSPRVEAAPKPSPLVLGYLSRIAPKKNLIGVIQAMAMVDADVELRVAGSVSDAKYMELVSRIIQKHDLASKVDFAGPIPPRDIPSFLRDVDVVAIPTWGENFGHAIWESLSYGRPVITGRDVIWEELAEFSAGWNVDPNATCELAEAIRFYQSLSGTDLKRCQKSAKLYARLFLEGSEYVSMNRALFKPPISTNPS